VTKTIIIKEDTEDTPARAPIPIML